jgi:2-keto-3-deoxy-L-rhamnonate aldolase RhmA
MNATEAKFPGVSAEALADLEAAARYAAAGVRDLEVMRSAAERMDRMREALPETNIAVQLIREGRDEE